MTNQHAADALATRQTRATRLNPDEGGAGEGIGKEAEDSRQAIQLNSSLEKRVTWT